MALPGVEPLLLPALQQLTGGPLKSITLAERLARRLFLTAEDLAVPHGRGKGTKFRNDVAWALVWLGKAGLIAKTQEGAYALTPEGVALTTKAPLKEFGLKQLEGFPSFMAATKRVVSSAIAPVRVTTEVSTPLQPEEGLRPAGRQVQEKLSSELLDGVRSLTANGFELLIVDLLGRVLASGAGGIEHARQRLGGTGDGGVDGVIDEDALGLGRVYVQAKRYKAGNTIGSPEILQFSGAITAKGANKGVFVTSSTFTPAAGKAQRDLAQTQQIRLIDGPGLVELMIRHGVGVRLLETFALHEVELGAYRSEGN